MARTADETGEGAAGDRGGSARSSGAAGRDLPLAGRVRERVNQELNARKDRASEVLTSIAGTVRKVGEPLHEESLAALGGYADRAAERLERLADDLRDRDVAELADDLRGVARRRPAAFAVTGFAAGLLAARFLKSTAGGRGSARAGTPRAGARSAGARLEHTT